MKKAYCISEKFTPKAISIIEEHGIEFIENPSDKRPDEKEMIELLKEYDILIIGNLSKITERMIKYIDKPTIIATMSVGLDHIDKVFFESPFVKIVNIKLGNVISVAEHIFALILALNKRIFESNQLTLEEKGHKDNIHEKPEEISNKILGLIGAGNITMEVIRVAKVFGMKMKCYTKDPDKHKDLLEDHVEFVTLDEVLEQSDIINVSIPLNDETRNLISKEKINLMKTTATFINTSKPEVVDNEALIQYTDLYDTFYVGLDIDLDNYREVFSKYRKNVIITPHIAGVSKQASEKKSQELANNIVNVAAGFF